MPNSNPIRAGEMASVVPRKIASTGSSIDIVADTITTATAHAAIVGTWRTATSGTGSCASRRGGGS